MGKDIRDLFDRERRRPQLDLSEGHEARFLERLDEELPKKSKIRFLSQWLPYVAAASILIGGSWAVFNPWQEGSITEDQPAVALEEPTEATPEVPIEEAVVEEEKQQEQVAQMNTSPSEKPKETQITLSDISPDLKKVENFFISSINVELASLKVSEEKQELVDAYLKKVKELGKEYDNLTKELNTIGVNEMTIAALIENLKIRLQLLQRLKKNLNHSNSNNHESNRSDSI